ncbi:hypothetical protein PMF13cell1_04495 [Blautia producta]|uniref:Uncharacterized protein n=1 Tax=Blautia producta TaxID=33035 RepID=A0A4P6M361_9FIRM|nr:hypothetical protein [Blautia producta]QBE98926.1 hypothetical protein PMF13cell1_04495 [Blautia producta]
MNSRDKGARGERELAGILRGHGYDCRRGQQFCGANGDADVVGLPAVIHRKNNCDWLVSMYLDDRIEMYREYEAGDADGRLDKTTQENA